MNTNLSNQLLNIVNKEVNNFISKISERYNIEKNELEDIWNGKLNKKPIKITETSSKSSPEISSESSPEISSESSPESSPKKSSETSNENCGCPYEFTKGKDKGKQCGSKPKGGKVYCSKHQKYEGKTKVCKPVPQVKSKIKKSTSPSRESPNKPVQIQFRKHKELGVLFHNETNLVLKSIDDKVIIGCINENKILDLTDENIETCKKYSFKFDKDYLPEQKKEQKINANNRFI